MSTESKVQAAKDVADFLDTLFEHKRANDVRALCRSNMGLLETCKRLSADNARLREM